MNIKFRPICISDLEMLRLHRNNISTRKWLENESLVSEDEQINWFNKGLHENFLIIQFNNLDVGVARVKKIKLNKMQVGMDLFEAYRGKGIALSCFKAIIKHNWKFAKIYELWVFLDNKPAISVYKKARFIIDNSCPPIYLSRKWDTTKQTYPYVKMVLKKDENLDYLSSM